MAYARLLLSGSTSGRQIPVVATSTPGTLVHTAVAGAASFDEVFLWAANVTAAARTLTVQWGGVSDPGDHLVKTVTLPPYSTRNLISMGEVLNGGLEIRAFCDSASGVNVGGFVLRSS